MVKRLAEKLKDGASALILMSLYMFMPMLITVEMAGTPKPSGSPITESAMKKEINQTSPTPQPPGVGGPEEVPGLGELLILEIKNESSDIFSLGPTQLVISGGPAPTVYRINYLNTYNARLPVDDPTISSDYGWREPPCDGCSSDHRGVDFVPGNGAPIYAILDGMVVESGFLGGYGYWVKLEHLVQNPENGKMQRWETIYAHMQENSIPDDVKIGAVVKKSQILGKVGSTGMSTGPHLHFELIIEGEHVNPLPLISEYEVYGTREGEDGKNEFVISYR
jgi:murein DD-endopeptidase MepM/ murein hydrolase activator NlpD